MRSYRLVKLLALSSIAVAFLAYSQDPIPRLTPLTVRGFRFEMKQCQKLSTKNVTCYFTITNLQADRIVYLWANGHTNPSYLVDSGGMQVQARGITLGSRSGGEYQGTDAVTDVTIKASLEFDVGDPQATSIAKLSMGLESGEKFRVEFRKIPLE